MLPEPNRLKKKKDFDRLFKEGKSFKGIFLYIKINGNAQRESRFGFVVGKNVSKLASRRNTLKRRMREAVRARIPEVKKGIDCVIVAGPKGAGKESQDIRGQIDNLFKRAGMIQY